MGLSFNSPDLNRSTNISDILNISLLDDDYFCSILKQVKVRIYVLCVLSLTSWVVRMGYFVASCYGIPQLPTAGFCILLY